MMNQTLKKTTTTTTTKRSSYSSIEEIDSGKKEKKKRYTPHDLCSNFYLYITDDDLRTVREAVD
jgi:Mn-dependent DtxR family transcriptional regulator